jgi:hypothetical protein
VILRDQLLLLILSAWSGRPSSPGTRATPVSTPLTHCRRHHPAYTGRSTRITARRSRISSGNGGRLADIPYTNLALYYNLRYERAGNPADLGFAPPSSMAFALVAMLGLLGLRIFEIRRPWRVPCVARLTFLVRLGSRAPSVRPQRSSEPAQMRTPHRHIGVLAIPGHSAGMEIGAAQASDGEWMSLSNSSRTARLYRRRPELVPANRPSRETPTSSSALSERPVSYCQCPSGARDFRHRAERIPGAKDVSP